MKIRIEKNRIYMMCIPEELKSYTVAWGMEYIRKNKVYKGDISLKMLNDLKRFKLFNDDLQRELDRLSRIKEQVELERKSEDVNPLCDYPVKLKMFNHQVRGANMALLTLGLLEED